ncbi:MAG: sigma-E processing peptidase SpoIIGA [Bacillota bacterium]|nr:sigma-E processing peptidase SpoIIGA [Bacillota bacterium]
MPEYTLYVDVWLLRLGCNFIFEYLLLWATANVLKINTRPSRLVLGSAVGTIYYLLYRLASLNLLPFYGLLRFFPMVILVSLAMVVITFYPFKFPQLIRLIGYFYGIGFASAGAGLAGAFLIGGLEAPHYIMGTFISILTILIIAELGWGIVHERMASRIYQIPLEILIGEHRIKLKSLIDTGNSLKDPLNQKPVIIVEQQAVSKFLPPLLNETISSLEENALCTIEDLASLDEWQKRIRLIPYNSIGKKNGMLIGFRPDAVLIENQILKRNLHPTIAIHPHPLDPNGEYEALVPAYLIDTSYESTNFRAKEGGKTHVSTSSSDV